MKGILTRNEDGICMVKWSDLQSFAHGTHWMYTELSPESNQDKGINIWSEYSYTDDFNGIEEELSNITTADVEAVLENNVYLITKIIKDENL